MEQSFKMHTPFFERSSILPGVPTSKWTGWYKRMISSFKLVPPVVTMTWIFRCFPSSLHTCDVWRANSRVGTSITTEKKLHECNEYMKKTQAKYSSTGSADLHSACDEREFNDFLKARTCV